MVPEGQFVNVNLDLSTFRHPRANYPVEFVVVSKMNVKVENSNKFDQIATNLDHFISVIVHATHFALTRQRHLHANAKSKFVKKLLMNGIEFQRIPR